MGIDPLDFGGTLIHEVCHRSRRSLPGADYLAF